MYNNYTPLDKTVINCVQCRNKLRVPTNRGKIAVQCPVCRKEFVYNPNSILHTLRQIVLSMMSSFSKLPKNRKRLIILIIAAVVSLAVLFFLFWGKSGKKAPEAKPQLMIHDMRYENFIGYPDRLT